MPSSSSPALEAITSASGPVQVEGPVLTIVMDGVGVGSPTSETNAVAKARTPNLDALAASPLSLSLAAHGTSVGMPSDADMGNSEVGHNAIGAGRIFAQGAKLVADAVRSGALFSSPTWGELVAHTRSSGGGLHLIGLLSDGNVHSHISHVKAILSAAAAAGLTRVYVHALLDGRDVPPTSALNYVEDLEAHLRRCQREAAVVAASPADYAVASGGGRMTTTMDRYGSDWSMVERGWQTQVLATGRHFVSLGQAIETLRCEQSGIGDQNLPCFVIKGPAGKAVAPIEDGDAVLLFNFRGDRMLQCCSAFSAAKTGAGASAFEHFDRERVPEVFLCGMTLYDGDTQTPARFLVSPPQITSTLSELLCDAGVSQLACSETLKFGHVTYFWNGNRSGYFDRRLETYIEVPSHRPPFEARPAMKAFEIGDAVLKALAGGIRSARVNLANGDMVGHTGNFEATVAAVEATDMVVGTLVEAVVRAGGACIVTADHGNADDMAERNKAGEILRDAQGRWVPKTSHSLSPVPCHIALPQDWQSRYRLADIAQPGLGHLAATMASLLGYRCPPEYLPSLIELV